MFSNIFSQPAVDSLISDINKGLLPGALLFSGDTGSGKLSCALEVARVLSCSSENEKGKDDCECKSCIKSKSLILNNTMLMGPRDCILEIKAFKENFLDAVNINAPYICDNRYLFIKAIRKLTLRFDGILWQGENNLSKIGALVEEINENLELIDFPSQLPEYDKLERICKKIESNCEKLEEDFLYDSIPVNQIRNMEEWAHIKSENGKKIIIIENAERMLAGVRNALLKILEEPPADCVFILLTSKRNSIMQTILSRVRTYNFNTRTIEIQQKILKEVFHKNDFDKNLNQYFLSYLPVPPSRIKLQADIFYKDIANKRIPDVAEIVKKCGNFKPRIELRLFFIYLMNKQKCLMQTQQGCEFCIKADDLFIQCIDNVTLYNQTPSSVLDMLVRELSTINIHNGGIMRICEDM